MKSNFALLRSTLELNFKTQKITYEIWSRSQTSYFVYCSIRFFTNVPVCICKLTKFNFQSVGKWRLPVTACLQFPVMYWSSVLQYLRGMFPFITGSATFFYCLPIVITQNGSIIRSYVRSIRQFSDIEWIFSSTSEPLVELRVGFLVRKEVESCELQQSTETWR